MYKSGRGRTDSVDREAIGNQSGISRVEVGRIEKLLVKKQHSPTPHDLHTIASRSTRSLSDLYTIDTRSLPDHLTTRPLHEYF